MQAAPRSLDRFALFLMVFLCASWGFNQVTAKLALAEIPPLTQASARSAIGMVLVGAVAFWRYPKLLRPDGTLAGGLLCGFFFALEFIALFIGLQWTSASHAILFLYTAPFFVALGLRFVAPDERLSRLQWAGLCLSFVGVALALGVDVGSRQQFWGDVLSLLAGAFWGATTLVVKGSRLKYVPAEKALLYQLGVSAILIGVAAWAAHETVPTRLSPLVALCFAYQCVWVVSVTFVLWFWMMVRYRAGELSALTFLTPIFGVLAGAAILGERLTLGFAGAVVLVAAGIAMVNWPVREQRA